MTETLTKSRTTTKTVLREPKKYKVVFYDDNVTPMDFVVALLMKVFRHSEESAAQIMLKVHNKGRAVAGVYVHEVAEQKANDCAILARNANFPLVVKAEPE